VRRLLVGLLAFLGITGTILVVPVYASPGPEPEPVETSTEQLEMGSVEDPAPEAEVQEGTTEPVAGVTDAAPTLTVSATDVAEFSLVGVTWDADPAVTDTVVQVRVQDAAGAWGDWTEVGTDDGEQAPGAGTDGEVRGGTAPLWTGPSTAVEAELVTRSGAQPTDVRLDLVDPGDSAADATLSSPEITDTAHAAMTMPAVFSRAQWSADESIMGWDPEYAPTIKAATLHHTADTNNYTAEQVPAMMRSIYRYHAVSRGWGDIGYNVIVDKFGRLWEGRAGGLSRPVVGAHAGGFNTGTFGVSMLGTYETVAVPPGVVDAVSAIIAWKFSLHGVNPTGTTTLTSGGGGTARYAAGVRVNLPTIFGHRDVGSTSCPGNQGYARLGDIRGQVVARLAATQHPITDRYQADALLRQQLGAARTGEWSTGRGDGHYQLFANGALYWSPATGVRVLFGDSFAKFQQLGYEQGPLGFPTSDQLPTGRGDGVYNTFQNGALYRSAGTGAHAVVGAIHTRWAAMGYEQGPLGWPTSDRIDLGDRRGQRTDFQRGSLVWTPTTGAHTISGSIGARWEAQRGLLGYPTTDQLPTSTRTAVYTFFENGAVYDSAATGVRTIDGEVFRKWAALGYETGPMGLPTSDTIGIRDGRGRFSTFAGGAVYWSPDSGAHTLSGAIYQRWVAQGWEGGPLGYPVTDQLPTGGRTAVYTFFQGGAIYDAPATGVRIVARTVLDRWAATGYEAGPLGFPTADSQPVGDGRGTRSQFQGGVVVHTPTTGARVVRGAVRTAWETSGGPTGTLGYPTSEPLPTSGRDATYTTFERGAVYELPGGRTRVLVGDFHRRWAELGYEHGYLGYPTGDRLPTYRGTGQYQVFDGGAMYSSPATGVRVLRGEIYAHWVAGGWEQGPLGFPTSDQLPTRDGDGRYTTFQGGAIYWSAATGAHAMLGPIHQAWVAQGWEHGRLGYPIADAVATSGGGSRVDFQGGSLTYDEATGAVTTRYR
jgi:uncharacterized protein with LGFP repeats